MRVGKNPFKNKKGKFTPAKVGIVSLTYIPFLSGYYEYSFEVLKIHLESLLLTQTDDCNLLVFDNGSCPEVTDFLQAEQQREAIDWLVLSNHNMSKAGAINWAFSVLENDYLAFTDSDILFRSGWVEESLEIFDHFDKAGIVAVQPPFFDLMKDEFLSVESIRADGRYQVDEAIPDQRWVEEYCRGVGISEEKRKHYETRPLFKATARSGAGEAWIGATHAQFMVSQEVAKAMLPLPVSGRLMPADAKEINRKPEALGYWQLSTIDSFFYHMGNVLNEQVLEEFSALKRMSPSSSVAKPEQLSFRTKSKVKGRLFKFMKRLVLKIPGLRNLFIRFYGFLFRLVEE
jgi:glycosyltransferase involved in cell wall biosynthesis